MAFPLTDDEVEKRYNLITRNLQEKLGSEETMKKIIKARPYKIYWGTAPTGRVHIGYFVPLLKLADFLDAGCEVQVLIADLHALLDTQKVDKKQIDFRSKYYELCIKGMLKVIGVDVSMLKFVRGTSYQLSPEYSLDKYRLHRHITLHHAHRAGTGVVKANENPDVNSLLYPGMQALDEEYLKVDAQFGGVDQRKIFVLAQEFLPKIKLKKRAHLMNFMVPGLSVKSLRDEKSGEVNLNVKMSASNENTKIDVLDGKKKIKKKIAKAYCREKDIEDNTPFVFLKSVVFPILERLKRKLVIERPKEYGGTVSFDSAKELSDMYVKGELSPVDLKMGLTFTLADLLEPIRKTFEDKDNAELLKKSYK